MAQMIRDDYQLRLGLSGEEGVISGFDRIGDKAEQLALPLKVGMQEFERSMQKAEEAGKEFARGMDKSSETLEGFGKEKDEVIGNLAALQRQLIIARKEAEELGGASEETGRSFGKWSVAFSKLLIGFGVFQSVRFIVSDMVALGGAIGRLAENSARLDDTARAFQRLAGRGSDATLTMVNIERAAGGVIGRMTLMQEATRAAVSGLPVERFDELVRVSRGLAAVMGRDVTEALQRMTAGIAKQEGELFDEFGLVVRLNDVLAEHAANLNTTADALSATERQQAYFNAVVESGERKLSALGGVLDEAQAPFLRLRSAGEDLTTEFGSFLNRSVEVDNFVDSLASTLQGLAEAMSGDARKSAVEFARGVDSQIKSMEDFEDALERVTEKIPKLQEEYRQTREAGGDLSKIEQELTENIQILARLFPQFGINVRDLEGDYKALESGIRGVIKAQEGLVKTSGVEFLKGESSTISQIHSDYQALSKAQETLQKQTRTLKNEFQELGLEQVVPKIWGGGKRSENPAIDTIRMLLVDARMLLKDENERLVDAFGPADEAIADAYIKTLGLAGVEIQGFRRTVADIFKDTSLYTEKIGEGSAAIKLNQAGIIALNDALKQFTETTKTDMAAQISRLRSIIDAGDSSGEEIKRFDAIIKSFNEGLTNLATARVRVSDLLGDTARDISAPTLDALIQFEAQMAKIRETIDKTNEKQIKPDVEADELLKKAAFARKQLENELSKQGIAGAARTEALVAKELEVIQMGLEAFEEADRKKIESEEALRDKVLDLDTNLNDIRRQLREQDFQDFQKNLEEKVQAELDAVDRRIQGEERILEEGRKLYAENLKTKIGFDELSKEQQLKISLELVKARAVQDKQGIIAKRQAELEALRESGETFSKEQEMQLQAATETAAFLQEQADRTNAAILSSKQRLLATEGRLERRAVNEAKGEEKRLSDTRKKLREEELDREKEISAGLVELTEARIKALWGSEEEIRQATIALIQARLDGSNLVVEDQKKLAGMLRDINTEIAQDAFDAIQKQEEALGTIRDRLNRELKLLDFTKPSTSSAKAITNLVLRTEDAVKDMTGTTKAEVLELLQLLREAADQILAIVRAREIDKQRKGLEEFITKVKRATEDLARTETFSPDQILQAQRRLAALGRELDWLRKKAREAGIFDALASDFKDAEDAFARLTDQTGGSSKRIAFASRSVVKAFGAISDSIRALSPLLGRAGNDAARLMDTLLQSGELVATGKLPGIFLGVAHAIGGVFDFVKERQEQAIADQSRAAEELLARAQQLAGDIGSTIQEALREGTEIDYEQMVRDFSAARVAEQISAIVASHSKEALTNLEDAIAFSSGAGERFENAVGEEMDKLRLENLRREEQWKNTQELLRQQAEANVRERGARLLETAADDLEERLRESVPIIRRFGESMEGGLGKLEESSEELDDQIQKAAFNAVTEPQANQMIALLGSSVDFERATAANTARMVELMMGGVANTVGEGVIPGVNRGGNQQGQNVRLEHDVNLKIEGVESGRVPVGNQGVDNRAVAEAIAPEVGNIILNGAQSYEAAL